MSLKTPSMRIPGAAAATFCFLCWTLTRAAAGGETPLTPGDAALLVTPVTANDVQLLPKAIADSDARVRMIAARVAGILNRRDLAAPLLELASREQDAPAAAEQMRAVLFLRGETAIADAKAVAVRVAGPAAAALAEWLGRQAPQEFAAHLGDLAKRETDQEQLADIVAMAVQQSPGYRDTITERWSGIATPKAWRIFVAAMWESDHRDAAPLKEGLASSRPEIREATLWYATGNVRGMESRAGELTNAIADSDRPLSEWGEFARELLGRRLLKRKPIDRTSVIRQHGADHRDDLQHVLDAAELTDTERAALRDVAGDAGRNTPPNQKQPYLPDQPRLVTSRNFPQIAPGLLTSLAEKVGCALPASYDVYTGARVAYQADGRPQNIGIDASKVSAACGRAVRVLAFLTLAARNEPVVPDRTVWLFLPMERSIVRCIDEAQAPPLKIDVRQGIKRPEKVKHVNPNYPPSAQRDGKQGTVIIEATISPSGCVHNAAVIRSVDIRLDIEALRAVSQWRFQPALVGGTAVPVIMTVTVNFALQ